MKEAWRQVERYKALHAADIRLAQKDQPRKVLERMAAVITAEGDFAGRVNADWAAVDFRHPLQEQYNSLVKEVPCSPPLAVGGLAGDGTRAPQALLSSGGSSRQVQSAGGQEDLGGPEKAVDERSWRSRGVSIGSRTLGPIPYRSTSSL